MAIKGPVRLAVIEGQTLRVDILDAQDDCILANVQRPIAVEIVAALNGQPVRLPSVEEVAPALWTAYRQYLNGGRYVDEEVIESAARTLVLELRGGV